MNILIVGSGGREHALGWKLRQSPKVNNLYFAPGNGGTHFLGENIQLDSSDIDDLVKWSRKRKIDMVVIGPEAPLEKGIVDSFESVGINCFGPSKKAARLETDKAWALQFMERHHIPHPAFKVFQAYKKALEFVQSKPWPGMVIKASGLAAGKGVLLPETNKDCQKALKLIMLDKEFGDAGNKVIIQERIQEIEASLLAFSDGESIVPMIPVQDYKRAQDCDRGLNTGGMGTYAPSYFMKKSLVKKAWKTVLKPAVDGMKKEGYPFKGILYAGLMLTKRGPQVIEFNTRFGDPETQPLMMLLESDLFDILNACVHTTLNSNLVKFKKGSSVCVVLASGGYPKKYKKGKFIHGLDTVLDSNVQVFHAGTVISNGKIVTNGGRVLGVTAYGKTIKEAVKKTYHTIGKQSIYFARMHYRRDIAMVAAR